MSENNPAANAPVASGPTKRATFYGSHDRDITANKQVAIPKPFKRILDAAHEEELLLAHFHWQNEPYLRLYTKTQLDAKIDEVKNDPAYSEEQRAEKMGAIAEAAEPIEPDSQGRFVLPARWFDLLKFKDAVVFTGRFSYIRVWPAQAYEENKKAGQEQPEQPDRRLTNKLSM